MPQELHTDNRRQIPIAELAITFYPSNFVMITTSRPIMCFTGHTRMSSHDHQTDHSLKESHHDNSRQATLALLAITTPFQQFRHDNNKQIAFFIGHTTFHSHDHQTDNSLQESRHDHSRQTTIASLATTIFSRQPRPDSNKQVTFYPDEVTFHSHDHQTDNLLKESRHDNRQITIVSLATMNYSDLTITSRLQS